jgi:hypothetical protein
MSGFAAPAPAWLDPEDRRLRRWVAVSLGLHVALALAGVIWGYVKPLPPPVETPVTVEFTSPVPPQQAQGERPAPAPSPVPTPEPAEPAPPAPPEPPRNAPPQPAPPPPPPPPAPAAQPVPAPPSPAQPTPPPPQTPPPRPTPTPPPPPPTPAPQPTPTPPPPPARPAPATPTPPIPLPPPPAPPPPQPAQTAGTGRTPPVQRPEENSRSVENTLERLRAQQAQQQPPTGRPNPQAGRPAAGGGSPTGTAPLTQGEIRGLADQITECWAVDAGMLALSDRTVDVQLVLDDRFMVRRVVIVGRNGPNDRYAEAFVESVRRALLSPQCNPLRFPPEKRRAIEESTFRFNPRGLVPR